MEADNTMEGGAVNNPAESPVGGKLVPLLR